MGTDETSYVKTAWAVLLIMALTLAAHAKLSGWEHTPHVPRLHAMQASLNHAAADEYSIRTRLDRRKTTHRSLNLHL
jgi:hypothetical protein